MTSMRERLMDEALRLFGEVGYSRASIAQIETAAGLSGGAGGLYRHFSSKQELLIEAVRSRLNDWGPYADFADPEFSAAPLLRSSMPDATLTDHLTALCQMGLVRADHVKDVTRILMRDNSIPAGLLDAFRTENYEIVVGNTTSTLRDLAAAEHRDLDWRPTAEVLVGAVSQLWLRQDIYGDRPSGIDADSYIRATAHAIATSIENPEGTA